MGVLESCFIAKMYSFLVVEDFLMQSSVSGSISSIETVLSTLTGEGLVISK